MIKNDRQLSRREQKKLETRQSLIEAAFQLFSEAGYDATTVEDITDAVGVAKGTFFNYFPTKEAVLPAIAAHRLGQLASALSPDRGLPASPIARIKLALRLVAQDPLCEQQLAQRLFFAIMRRREFKPGHALRDLLAEQVRQGQMSGEIRKDLDPVSLAGAIHALFFHQLAMWYQGHRPVPLPTMIDAAVDLLMDGAAGPEWDRRS